LLLEKIVVVLKNGQTKEFQTKKTCLEVLNKPNGDLVICDVMKHTQSTSRLESEIPDERIVLAVFKNWDYWELDA